MAKNKLVRITANIFPLIKNLDELEIDAYLYEVKNLSYIGEERYRMLNNIAHRLGNILKGIAIPYTPREDFNGIIVFNPEEVREEINEIDKYTIVLSHQINEKHIIGSKIDRFFYILLRARLEFHGFWPLAYNKYFRPVQDTVIDGKFRIFRGLFFRFDVLKDGRIILILDVLSKIISNDTISEIASQMGYEKAKKMLAGRYALVRVVRRQEVSQKLCKIHRFRPDLAAGKSKIINIGDRWYSIKEYYEEYLKKPQIARQIPDDDPVIEVVSESGKTIYFAASMAYLNHRISDLKHDEIKSIEGEIYLDPKRRMELTLGFLKAVNPLQHPHYTKVGVYYFKETPLYIPNQGIFDAPELRFGNGTAKIDLTNYAKFFRASLRKYGVAKEVGIPANMKVAIIYPENLITEPQVREFYKDIRYASKIFQVNLPRDPYVWGYRDNAIQQVLENYRRFKDKVLGVITVLRSKDDELYDFFKKTFGEDSKVSQMATVELVMMKSTLPEDKLHIYKSAIMNLAAGFLGKLGLRAWLLNNKLNSDLYIGLDVSPKKSAVLTLMDAYGNYLGEEWFAITGAKIPSDSITSYLRRLINRVQFKSKSSIASIVFMRDGDIYDEEINGFKEFIKELGSSISGRISYAIISVKKNVPYRLYANKGTLTFIDVGAYIVLDYDLGIIATTGAPVLKGRLAKPLLVELVEAFPSNWYNIRKALNDVYYLSYMHWATLTQKMKLPAPLKYADDFSYFAERGIKVAGPPL